MRDVNLGVVGIGVYLPPQIRRNDWWPAEAVARWQEAPGKSVVRARQSDEAAPTRGLQLGLQAMAELKDDPFRGTRERRVRPAAMPPSQMELAAARDALTRTGIAPEQLGLILTTSQGPDTLMVPNAPILHRELGVPAECICTSIEGVCNSFMLQLQFAQALIQTGRVQYALLVQSCMLTSLVRPEDPFSPWFGDGATAVVVGPTGAKRGLLSMHHETDGSLYSAMLVGDPEGPWYEGRAARVYIEDFGLARRMAMSLADFGQHAIESALRKANLTAKDVGFIATHQGTGWLRRVTQTLIDAPQARSCDTFAWTASLGPANIPFCLAMGEREGLLKPDDLVVSWTGGAGITYSGMALRWGI